MSDNPTTKSVLDWMKQHPVPVPDGGYAKAAPEAPRVPARPLSGTVDELLTLSAVYERMKLWEAQRATPEQLAELRQRVEAAPGKIAAAQAAGADAAKIKAAKEKLVELEDKLTAATLAEARWYMLSAAYAIMRDFRVKAGNGLSSVVTEAGGTLVFDLPGVLTFRADLTGPDDEPPF